MFKKFCLPVFIKFSCFAPDLLGTFLCIMTPFYGKLFCALISAMLASCYSIESSVSTIYN